MGKSKKGRNTKATDDADVDDIVNEIEGLKVGSLDNKETGDEATSKSKKTKKKKDKKKVWDEDELLDDIAALANNEGETETKPAQDQEEEAPTSKKNKKKKDKKKGWDEDELMDDIAALANDEGETETKPAQDQEEQAPTKKDKKKGKKKKKGFDEDDIMDELAEMEAEMEGGKKVKGQVSEEKEEADDGKKKPTHVEDKAEGEEESTGGIKTAAQKKAEKKERERKKKEQQRLEAKNRKLKQEAKSKKEDDGEEGKKDKDDSDVKVKAEAEGDAKDNEEAEGEDEEEQGDKKKKKKKKGKGEEKEEKKKGKGMGKSQLKAMQEALQKMKEEEARLKAEEEAKIKAEEEAERLRLEKLQKEKERKEREKQKKKEKIERMKREGTYLTPAQKQAKARAEAMLAAMREQGIEVPQKEKEDATPDTGTKKVRYGTRQKKNKSQKPQESQEKESAMETESTASVETSETQEQASDTTATEDATTDATEATSGQEEKEEVKDSWDISSEEEEEEEEKDDKPSPDETPQKQITVQAKKEDEEEEEDDDDEEESSEEESETEESDSEEESSSDSEDDRTNAEKMKEKAMARIKKRREDNEAKRSTDELRCPVVCVLGHVDTGKTKILDKIRHTNVQDGEAGGITQQIGATRVPDETIREQTKMCRQFAKSDLKFPGLLIIDTPGHESFSNLRSRGSSLCDIAILVVDIMHGLEPQTIESLNLLRSRKTPFIVALNKIDRLFEWKSSPHTDIANVIKKQKRNTKDEFDERLQKVVIEFAEQGMNAALFYDNPDPKSYVSLVPTSAHSGDGMGNLIALICELSQTMLAKRLAFSENLQCTTLEVKALPGLGTTIDVVLVNGRIREGQTIILAGQEGVITTQVRGLLMPQPLRELRVKNAYEHYKELKGAQGIKILAKDLDKALAGMPLLVAEQQDEVDILKEEVAAILKDALKSIKLSERGVFVQASTLGSLEALLEFLKTSKIPYAGINIGPVHKRDVMKASVMLEHDNQYAVILAFDVKIEREAQEMADREGIKIFQADIIYHLFDRFTAHREELRLKKREEFKHIAVFPCKLKILPQCIFNARNPIVVGVTIEGGIVKEGTPIVVPNKENLNIGVISSIEVNHKQVETARKGQEVCIKIENVGNDAPKMVGRHFDPEDLLISKISRESIDAVKNYFREDLEKADWQVMIELKKILEIL